MAKRPKKSGIPPTVESADIHGIADARAPFMQTAIINTVNGFTGTIPTKQIEDLLSVGAFNTIDSAIPWRDLQEAIRDGAVSEEMHKGLLESIEAINRKNIGEEAKARELRQLTKVKPALTFDSQNPNVRRFINVQVGELITSITNDSRKSVKQIIEASRFRETTVAETAKQIKSVVGLRPDQTSALNNFINKLMKDKVPKRQIAKLSTAFAKQKLAERANMISRTEMMTAVNGGHQVGWEQAAAEGYFDPDKATVRWVVIDDGPRLCPTCESMEDVPRPFKGVWKVEMLYRTAGGAVKRTGRTKMVKIPSQAHPNCRCTMTLDIESEEGTPE